MFNVLINRSANNLVNHDKKPKHTSGPLEKPSKSYLQQKLIDKLEEDNACLKKEIKVIKAQKGLDTNKVYPYKEEDYQKYKQENEEEIRDWLRKQNIARTEKH